MSSITQTCAISGKKFVVTPDDLEFYHAVGPEIANKKFPIPPPTHCPEERLRRRLAFRNERFFYRVKCALTGKSLVSIYSPDKNLKVVERSAWRELDNREHGREYNFSRSFFSQFNDLYRSTWKGNVIQASEMVNSEYTSNAGRMKNCYLLFDSGQTEDCSYGVWLGYSRDCYDTYCCGECELCYDSTNIFNCYQTYYSTRCQNCSFSALLYDCIGCKNCIGCSNLRNKEYYLFNEPVSKEKFNEAWSTLFSGSRNAVQMFRDKFTEVMRVTPRRAVYNVQCTDSIGDDLSSCENVFEAYNCSEAKNSKYVWDCYFGIQDSYDVSGWGEGMEWSYELSSCGGLKGTAGITGCLFSVSLIYGGFDVLYSINCIEQCKNLFGCCDLIKKEYCILNKQYTKDEYEALVPKIIEQMKTAKEWGEFFPIGLSLFGYNESLAQEFLPLSKDQAKKVGASWCDYEMPAPEAKSVVNAKDLPDSIHDVDDSILNSAVRCEVSGKLFKFTKAELAFYRNQGIPLPRRQFIERHQQRISALNPRKLWKRQCSKTGETLLSSYAPDRPEIIFGEAAYRELIG